MIQKLSLLLRVVVFFVFLLSGTGAVYADDTKPLISLDDLEGKISSFKPDFQYRDDAAALITLQEALVAAKEGNYGIGTCLIREKPVKSFSKAITEFFYPIIEVISMLKRIHLPATNRESNHHLRFKNLPPIWQEIAKGRIYEPAQCSPELKDIADQVFKYSSHELDERLKKE
jgi:hypothetical protein